MLGLITISLHTGLYLAFLLLNLHMTFLLKGRESYCPYSVLFYIIIVVVWKLVYFTFFYSLK